jgi:hypothetical protein
MTQPLDLTNQFVADFLQLRDELQALRGQPARPLAEQPIDRTDDLQRLQVENRQLRDRIERQPSAPPPDSAVAELYRENEQLKKTLAAIPGKAEGMAWEYHKQREQLEELTRSHQELVESRKRSEREILLLRQDIQRLEGLLAGSRPT